MEERVSLAGPYGFCRLCGTYPHHFDTLKAMRSINRFVERDICSSRSVNTWGFVKAKFRHQLVKQLP